MCECEYESNVRIRIWVKCAYTNMSHMCVCKYESNARIRMWMCARKHRSNGVMWVECERTSLIWCNMGCVESITKVWLPQRWCKFNSQSLIAFKRSNEDLIVLQTNPWLRLKVCLRLKDQMLQTNLGLNTKSKKSRDWIRSTGLNTKSKKSGSNKDQMRIS